MFRCKSSVHNKEFFQDTEYGKQYYKTYCIRLECMIDVLHRRVIEKLGSVIVIKKLSDLETDERCIVIGTLYKHMENKPSVIKELTDAHQLGLRPAPPHKLTSVNDQLFLEDSQQRIQLLSSSINANKYVTGVIVAVLGHESETSKGVFIVEDVVHATPSYSIIKNPEILPQAQYIAIISGIGIEDNSGVAVILKLALDWMCGSLFIGDIAVDPRSIGRLIIAGDSLGDCRRDEVASQSKFVTKKTNLGTDLPMEVLDQLLNDACPSIPIDIMPGPNDPTSIVLPQKPLHKVMFPKSAQWTTFKSRPNPWLFTLDNDAFVIGTSGQNIDDIDRYSDINDPLDRLRATITWGHLAPTAPDTLPTYPNAANTDPLVMPHRPYLYFSGNQDKFAWERSDADGGSTMLVTVPRFKDTGSVVLVDVHHNSCACINFQ